MNGTDDMQQMRERVAAVLDFPTSFEAESFNAWKRAMATRVLRALDLAQVGWCRRTDMGERAGAAGSFQVLPVSGKGPDGGEDFTVPVYVLLPDPANDPSETTHHTDEGGRRPVSENATPHHPSVTSDGVD